LQIADDRLQPAFYSDAEDRISGFPKALLAGPNRRIVGGPPVTCRVLVARAGWGSLAHSFLSQPIAPTMFGQLIEGFRAFRLGPRSSYGLELRRIGGIETIR
jgi:hypothetical protein